MSAMAAVVQRLSVMPGSRSIVLISPGYLVLSDLHAQETELTDRAIRSNNIVISSGWTALYDAVMLGLHELDKSGLKRKALLVVSDGGENNSRFSHTDLKRRVEERCPYLLYLFRHSRYEFWTNEMDGRIVRRPRLSIQHVGSWRCRREDRA